MTEEQTVVEEAQVEEQSGAEKGVTEEIKVQVEDLFKVINDVVREGTARRIKIFHHDRVLVDIPLWAGIGSGLLMAVYMAPVAALIGVGALLGGVTLRVEREKPPEA